MALGGLQSIGLRKVPRAASSWASAMERNGENEGGKCGGGSHCDLPLSQSRLLPCGFLPVEEVFGSNVSRLQTVEATLGCAAGTMQV